MADEFNTTGQQPNNTEPDSSNDNTANTTAHNEAQSEQQAANQQTGEPTPDYASAKGESTVVSSTPASNDGGQPTQPVTPPQYRPAPEYGAYGPAPTQPAQQGGTQPTQPLPPYGAPGGQNGQPGNRNPYNPFANPQNAQNGNPFGGQPPRTPFGAGQPGQPNQPGQPVKKGMSRTASNVLSAGVAAVVAAALSLGIGFAAITNGWVQVPNTTSLSSVNSNKSGSGSATVKSGEAPDWQSVASDVSDSVVSITTRTSDGEAKGSGAILDTEGHIVTNNHVISGAQQIQVTLSNGNIYSAQLVGTDTTTDLAVIKLDNAPSDLKAVEFADSDQLAVGEGIMAIGNPLGYDDTATTGIISALNRPVTVMDDNNNDIVTNAVQIDAAINPGNSGGPTFNAAGQVIGINSSIASTASSSSSAGSIGIGFAIPSNLVKRVANEIIKNGSVKHVALGITIQSGSVTADNVTRAGTKVVSVVSGGPADKAGIKEGDTIVAFNGNAVNSNYSLLGYVRAAALGDTAKITLVRDGKTLDVEVTLDKEESSVNGSNKSDSNNNNQQQDQNGQQNQDQNGQQDQDQNGQNGYGFGDGGLLDPFGLW